MKEFLDTASVVVGAVAVLLLLVGLAVSLSRYAYELLRGSPQKGYRVLRESVGRVLLLTLELLIAVDIIETLAVEPSFRSLGLLGLLVLIRTFLSLALEVELTGRWPGQRGEAARE